MNVIEVYVVGQPPRLYEDGRYKGERGLTFTPAGELNENGTVRFTWHPFGLLADSPADRPVLVNGKLAQCRLKPLPLADGDVVTSASAAFFIRTVAPASRKVRFWRRCRPTP